MKTWTRLLLTFLWFSFVVLVQHVWILGTIELDNHDKGTSSASSAVPYHLQEAHQQQSLSFRAEEKGSGEKEEAPSLVTYIDPLTGEEKTVRNWTTDAIFRSPNGSKLEEFLLYNKASPLNDKTMPWNTSKRRDWLWVMDGSFDQMKRPKEVRKIGIHPPAMVLLADAGWNQPDVYSGRRWFRSLFQRRLLKGIINHPWFHPTAWQMLRGDPSLIDRSIRYYVFADIETCGEKNYPQYLSRRNRDLLGNRDIIHNDLSQESTMQTQILAHPLFRSAKTLLVIFDCNGYTRLPKKEAQWWKRWIPSNNTDRRLSIVSISARKDQHLASSFDMGLPPPALNPCRISEFQQNEILEANCSRFNPSSAAGSLHRPFFLSFSGNFRHSVRKQLREFHNTSNLEGMVWMGDREELRNMTLISDPNAAFRHLASKSVFGAAPRGDNLFTFRFTEQLSCGAIPVVFADDWVFPFHTALMGPTSTYAVVIPEKHVNRTIEILSSISESERCQLRKEGLKLYQAYMKDGEGTIRGIIEALELLQT